MIKLQERAQHLCESTPLRVVVLSNIIFNAILLGFETSDSIMASFGSVVQTLNTICLALFAVELTLKLFAYQARFFRDGWNCFDFIVVTAAFMPAFDGIAVLRVLRILLVLRITSVFPALRRVVESLIRSLPGILSVLVLLAIIFFISSVFATSIYKENFPQWFGSLGESAFTLFQIMTLEAWSFEIVRPVSELHPFAWVFFIAFILATSFAVLNLIVGLIVNSFQVTHFNEEMKRDDAQHAELLARIDALEALIRENRRL